MDLLTIREYFSATELSLYAFRGNKLGVRVFSTLENLIEAFQVHSYKSDYLGY